MSTFLDIALDCIARGWAVIPCYAYGTHRQDCEKSQGGDKCTKKCAKSPLVSGGFLSASKDPAQAQKWWTKWPNANVAIAGGASGLAVVDGDHGIKDADDLRSWCERNGIPQTYTVRTGRRPEFGVQMYFAGTMPDVGLFHLDGCSGQVKSEGGYVMAAGSVHTDSGERYEVICDLPIAPLPGLVRALHVKKEKTDSGNPKVSKTAWSLPVHESENRTGFLLEQTGQLRNLGCGFDSILARMRELNEDPAIIADPISEERLEQTAANCAKYPVPEPEAIAVIGKPKEPEAPADWRGWYHTFDEMNNAPEPSFIVEGVLQKDVITAIAGLVGQRKTIIAANMVHASITGEALFDHFKVVNRPARVLYLCPEMGLLAFAKRIRNLGLMEYVGKTLFCRTMNSESKRLLGDMTKEELAGALVVIDTAVRFVQGDENSSEDMKVFAEDCFRLMKEGAASVVVLFHSPKGMADASELTLENAMRGSGDLGAFVSCCWATRMQDPELEWKSTSYLKCVKQRDFEADPFTVKSDNLGRLHIVDTPGSNVKLSTKKPGTKADKDGKDEERLDFLRKNPQLSNTEAAAILKKLKMGRSPEWVRNKRKELEAEDKDLTYRVGGLTVSQNVKD